MPWFRAALYLLLATTTLDAQEFGTLTTVAGGGPLTLPLDGQAALTTTVFSLSAVAVSPGGNVYFAMGGSGVGPQVVVEILSDGQLKVVAGGQTGGFAGDGGPATLAQLNAPSGLVFDKAGNLFIADTNNNRIRRVDLNGNINTYAGNGKASFSGDSGPAIAAELNTPSALAWDNTGNLYIADTLNHRIRAVNPAGVITTFAGTGSIGKSGDGGPAAQAQIALPLGLAINSNGDVYISDTGFYNIRKVSKGIITTAASVYPAPGLTPAQDPGHPPYGIAFDPSGNLYIGADGFEAFILKLDPSGSLSVVAGRLEEAGDGGNFGNLIPFCCDGVAGTSSLISPGLPGSHTGVAVDSAGNLYIADIEYGRIRMLALNGIITTVAGTSASAYSVNGEGGLATSADLGTVWGVAVNRAGEPIFADGQAVRKVSSQGILTTVAGNGKIGVQGDGGPATLATLNAFALATDRADNIYIADPVFNRVRKVDSTGRITNFAGTGQAGSSGDGGQAVSANLGSPLGIAVDSRGIVYIAADNGIRRITPDGLIQTFVSGQYTSVAVDPSDTVYAAIFASQCSTPAVCAVGSSVVKFAADGNAVTVAGNGQFGKTGIGGPATQAPLGYVHTIAIDPVGTLYIGDAFDERVLYVQSDGILQVLAGNGGTGFSGDGGPATNATFNYPLALAPDSNGNVYIADTTNARIRKFTLAPNLQFTAAGLVNAASFQPASLADEEIVTWFGATQVSGVFQPQSSALPYTLGSTSISLKDSSGAVNGVPLYLVAPNQVSFMIPLGTPSGPATLTVQNVDGRSASAQISIGTVAPGLFSANSNGQGVAAAFAVHVASDGTQQTDPVFQCGASTGCTVVPVAFGPNDQQIVLSLYGTGIRHYATSISATVAGQSADVLFAGPQGTYFGLDQVNIAVPKSAAGSGVADIIVTADGKASNSVQVLFQ